MDSPVLRAYRKVDKDFSFSPAKRISTGSSRNFATNCFTLSKILSFSYSSQLYSCGRDF